MQLYEAHSFSYDCKVTSEKHLMIKPNSRKTSELRQRRDSPLLTPTDLTRSATKDITGVMNAILADVLRSI